MKDLLTSLKEYLDKNNLKLEDLAKDANISFENLKSFYDGEKELNKDDAKKIEDIVCVGSKISGKKIVKIIDLMFRFASTILALVSLLLCINGFEKTNTLIALLSISVVCTSLNLLPKIEK